MSSWWRLLIERSDADWVPKAQALAQAAFRSDAKKHALDLITSPAAPLSTLEVRGAEGQVWSFPLGFAGDVAKQLGCRVFECSLEDEGGGFESVTAYGPDGAQLSRSAASTAERASDQGLAFDVLGDAAKARLRADMPLARLARELGLEREALLDTDPAQTSTLRLGA